VSPDRTHTELATRASFVLPVRAEIFTQTSQFW